MHFHNGCVKRWQCRITPKGLLMIAEEAAAVWKRWLPQAAKAESTAEPCSPHNSPKSGWVAKYHFLLISLYFHEKKARTFWHFQDLSTFWRKFINSCPMIVLVKGAFPFTLVNWIWNWFYSKEWPSNFTVEINLMFRSSFTKLYIQ